MVTRGKARDVRTLPTRSLRDLGEEPHLLGNQDGLRGNLMRYGDGKRGVG